MMGPVRNATRSGGTGPSIAEFARRRTIELAGFACTAVGIGAFLALATYDVSDPSLNTAVRHAPRNLLGVPGAIGADLLVQSMGLAGILLALTLTVWGWRLMRHRLAGRFWIRLLSLPIGLLLTAIALAALDTIADPPLAAGWGGATGSMLLADTRGFMVDWLGLPGWIAPALAVTLGAAAAVVALGLSADEWRDVGAGVGRAGAAGVRVGRQGGNAGVAAGGRMFHFLRSRRDRADRPAKTPPRITRDEDYETQAPPPIGLDMGEDEEPALAPTPRAQRTALVETDRKKPKPAGARQGKLDLGPSASIELPPLDHLDPPPEGAGLDAIDEMALAENARLLESVLDDFGVRGEIVKVRPGPVVTLYELEPAPGTKSSRVIGLADDIARSMSAVSVRVAVIPGRNVIGIELPNHSREIVYLRQLLTTDAYTRGGVQLTLALGKDIGGSPIIADLARMPHLLIAGTTGSGKSVAINTMILSLLYRLSPEACKFIMIDPKMLELSVYDGIPHLLAPVVTDPSKAVVALRWVVREMENRYKAMSTFGVRNIAGYNARLAEARKKGETLTRTVQTGFDPATGTPIYEEQPLDMNPLPFIVVIVDEMADLMLVAGKDVEAAVQRLAQMARASGIHLIMATQRPSVDVITGTIKANFPTRVSFQVTSKIDSRTILGEAGAEQLLGQGDMLYMAGGGRITRVHGPLVTDDEVERVVRFLREQGEPDYVEEVTDEDAQAGLPSLGLTGSGDGADELYDRGVALVCRERKASTSFIQRHLQIGYNRAARIIERMEAEGVVSGANHVGKREVLARDINDRTT